MKRKTTAAVIDFGTSKVTTVITDCVGKRCDPRGIGVVEYDGYDSSGNWNVPGELNDVIEQSLNLAQNEAAGHSSERNSDERIEELFVSVPGEHCNVYVRETSIEIGGRRVTQNDVDMLHQHVVDMLHINPSSIIAQSAAWYRFDDDDKTTLRPVLTHKNVNVMHARVSVVTADMDYINDMEVRMRGFGVHIAGFLSPAVSEAFLLIKPADRDRTVAVVDVGYLHTEVIVVSGDAMVDYRVLPIGGAHITLDITNALQVDFNVAEQVKRKFSFNERSDVIEIDKDNAFNNKFLRDVIGDSVRNIAEMVANELNDTTEALNQDLPVYLTGGGVALIDGSRDLFNSVLDRSVYTPSFSDKNIINRPQMLAVKGLIDRAIERLNLMSGNEEPSLGEKISDFFHNLLDRFQRKE